MRTPDNWSPASRKSEREKELASSIIDFQTRMSDKVAERLIENGDGELVEALENILRDDQENIILPIPIDDPNYSPDTPYYYYSEPELEELVEHAGSAFSRSELGTGE